MYYFGYGSNIGSRVMKSVCPDVEFIDKAMLRDYRLAFTRESIKWGAAAADVLPAAGKQVWGALYRIDDACLGALDVKESYGTGYDRMTVRVELLDGTLYEAITYFVIHKMDPEGLPSLAYIDTILEGALEVGFPDEYVRFLYALKDRLG